jgi:excisionase family DNA binding protein
VNQDVNGRLGCEELADIRRKAGAVEQMCIELGREVVSLSREVTEIVERPSYSPLAFAVEKAARLLGVGRSTMLALLSSGRVRSVRVGGRRLVQIKALGQFLEEHGDREVG